ncbi:Lrp/AsnC family transcriptional regulator [Halobaculum gomorrense]|uniref:DNA-binding transcriptional regulator, Lrp family n=1 Tax=Halobaculum gomorrense TaxID=43928 RepID=A0A1M5R2U0_9EURY|nr:Lrp/AsnC family transcriptional regulator [Halobaculum gomorrense]SHH20684.1 DNA-binding transcriptional regulator, Lrp family [Halobaculum gomorrense]
MDEATRSLLDALVDDARESTADLARQTGLDEATVEERLTELEASGALRGYTAVVDWDAVDEERVSAIVEVNVELDRETDYDDVARRIAESPAVDSLRLMSGDYDFAVNVSGSSMGDVSGFVSEEVAPLPAVTKTVTHYVMETYKERGVSFTDRDDDDRLSVTP